MNPTRRRLVTTGAVVASGVLAVSIGVRLSGYGVPLPLLLACCTSCLATFTSLAFHVADAAATTVHRCPDRGCDFRVRLTGTDAAESRRWQEIAATHPHRGL